MDLAPKSDEELVELACGELPGKTVSFDELLQRHKSYVFGLCVQKLNNIQDAEDAAQEVFVRVFFNIRKFRGEASFRTWLTRIALNVCLTLLLTRKRRFWQTHVSLDDEVDFDTIHASIITETHERFFWEKIGAVLKQMFTDYRRVFILKYFKDWSIRQIAARISATVDATKMKIKRAKDQFLKIFKET